MGPEAPRGPACPLGPHRPQVLQPDSPTLWRPWIQPPRDAEATRTGSQLAPSRNQAAPAHKGAFGFQHPVRLYLPGSKRQECLQSLGAQVLASFPVQATIHFYEDASDSEEDEPEEAARPCPAWSQEAGGLEEKGPRPSRLAGNSEGDPKGLGDQRSFLHADIAGLASQ